MMNPRLSSVGKEVQSAQVLYLKPDPLHFHEKPYKLRYDPGEEIPRSNCVNETQTITVKNLRGVEQHATLENDGFMWLPFHTSLTTEELYTPEVVQDRYYSETRKRHEQFPIYTGETYKHLQPTTIAHIDFTLNSALRISREFFGIPDDQYSRLQCINLWRPLRGPVSDWPLALCHPDTLDLEYETVGVDVVTRTGYTENAQLYYNPKQEWYYLSDQIEDEITLFCQIDTAKAERAGVAHTGFSHSQAANAERPRESIELRAFVYYD